MDTIVIIGAGPSGLTTAYELLKSDRGYKVILIEKEKIVGGISKTLKYKGNRMDLGGHRFFSKSKEINSLWLGLLKEQGMVISESLEPYQKKEYNGCVDPNQEDDVMLVRRRISRIYYLNKFFDYPISINWKTFSNMGIVRTVRCGFGYIYSLVFKRKENSLEDFYINRFGKPLYEMFFKDYTTKLWGVSPAELNPDWGSQRVKKLSLTKAVKDALLKKVKKEYVTQDSSLIEEFYYPKHGPGQLWEKMALEIIHMGGEIYIQTSCERIFTNQGKVEGIVIENIDKEQQYIPCDYLVSSMAIKDLIIGMGENCPKKIKTIAETLPYRDFITVGVLVNKLNLKNATQFQTYSDLVPDCWIYIQEKNVKMGRIQIFNNWSPYMVEKPRETVWIGLEYFCSQGDELWNMKEKEFIDFAINELVKMGIVSKENILDTTIHKVLKAYPAYYGSYEKMPQVRAYLDSFKNLICVGRNGQHRYNNMDHSMMTGILAASVIQGRADRDCVWEVNTECEYHEKRGE